MITIGIESAMASLTGVTVLVAPGPEVTITTPGFPVDRAYPEAMKPAPCSFEGTINGIGFSGLASLYLKTSSYVGKIAPPL